MAKNLGICLLLDFYANMLTDKQREVVELYYNEDLSLAEIAEHTGITRQGVRDSIKRAEMILLETEEKLGFAARLSQVKKGYKKIMSAANELEEYNRRILSTELEDIIATIRSVVEELISDE